MEMRLNHLLPVLMKLWLLLHDHEEVMGRRKLQQGRVWMDKVSEWVHRLVVVRRRQRLGGRTPCRPLRTGAAPLLINCG